ncbi:lysophospholipid acyltransferase family protein [Oleidesulfovibrio alaskensis]|uniref:lysophospholipid acyltransferase family protein n=1 Tax=Oleidesulfovibrio alaskensis TaxID=58180 RepID=UPI0003FF946A|nr:lysophospholipid acyltransferase family protein [Oleidesulfovibrio alaskensis]
MNTDVHDFTDDYQTPEGRAGVFSSLFPNVSFYLRMALTVRHAAALSKKNCYDSQQWVRSSLRIVHALERAGGSVITENTKAFKAAQGPCVFIGNHMSTLETFILPCIIQPHKDVTFVVKQSLVEYPFFKHVLLTRNPITVTRTAPREDLKAVLEGGEQRLAQGLSIIVFPQSTRSYTLDRTLFNSIGIKLAKRAGVPVVPVALDTRAWGIGRLCKDFGSIRPSIPARFRFGDPITVHGTGKNEHAQVCDFIEDALTRWRTQPEDTQKIIE